jgi:hypothetical protein
MKRVLYWLVWLAVITVFVIPILYSLANINSPGFLENFIGNWAATMIGVVVGIPIALWLSRLQQKEQERKEQEREKQEALARKSKILKLIKKELEYNRDQLLASRIEVDGVPKRVVFLEGLKDELWNAFSDGGELEWIKDLQLMDVISFAYHYIRREIYLEQLYMEIKRPKNWTNTPAEDLIKHLTELDPLAIKVIDQALDAIKNSIVATDSTKDNLVK